MSLFTCLLRERRHERGENRDQTESLKTEYAHRSSKNASHTLTPTTQSTDQSQRSEKRLHGARAHPRRERGSRDLKSRRIPDHTRTGAHRRIEFTRMWRPCAARARESHATPHGEGSTSRRPRASDRGQEARELLTQAGRPGSSSHTDYEAPCAALFAAAQWRGRRRRVT